MLKGKKILVTGGAGFIGSNLCERFLGQDNYVVCLDNLITGKKKNIETLLNSADFKFIEGDIRDMGTCMFAVKGIDYVFHQAALGSVPRSINDPIKTNEINISGFLNMITASKDAKVKRFIYAASSSTYGDSNILPKIEHEIGKPLSPYAVSKYVNELYADVYSKLYDLETIGLRYFNVFGRRQDPEGVYAAVIPKFIKLLINGEAPLINGDGESTRDFTYIDNVIQANELAALSEQQDAYNQVYNVAFGEKISLNELTSELIRLLVPFDKSIEDISPKYGPERLGDIKHSLASIEKAKKLLGYNPEYSVKQGLQKAIHWYWENLSS